MPIPSHEEGVIGKDYGHFWGFQSVELVDCYSRIEGSHDGSKASTGPDDEENKTILGYH